MLPSGTGGKKALGIWVPEGGFLEGEVSVEGGFVKRTVLWSLSRAEALGPP